MRRKLHIRPQYYPTCTGECPLSFAVYYGHTFLAYSWSLSGAWVALQYLRERMK